MISLILIGIIAIFCASSHYLFLPAKPANTFYSVPPVAVFIMRDCGSDLVINILLTILGYFPGKPHITALSLISILPILTSPSPFFRTYPRLLHPLPGARGQEGQEVRCERSEKRTSHCDQQWRLRTKCWHDSSLERRIPCDWRSDCWQDLRKRRTLTKHDIMIA